MDVYDFEGCCTAGIVVGFGQTNTAEYGRHAEYTVTEIIAELTREEVLHKDLGYGILTCTTNNEQKNANKALKIAGWKHSRWCSKGSHPETKIRLWFKPLVEVK